MSANNNRQAAGETEKIIRSAATVVRTFTVTNSGKDLSVEDLESLEIHTPDLPLGAEGLPMVLGMDLCAALAMRLGTRLETAETDDGAAVAFRLPVASGDAGDVVGG